MLEALIPFLEASVDLLDTRYRVDALLGQGGHGALEAPEGCVWRLERKGADGVPNEVVGLCKYVRPEKKDGALLTEATGGEVVWNWRPGSPLSGVQGKVRGVP